MSPNADHSKSVWHEHMRAFANICNNGVSETKMKEATISGCDGYNMGKWNPLVLGHSA